MRFTVAAIAGAMLLVCAAAPSTARAAVPFSAADVDADGCVSMLDVGKVALHFLQSVPPAPDVADVDGDGVVSIFDISAVTGRFGQCQDPQIIFGIGNEADVAAESRLNQQSPLGMYTSWYNGPADLNWMRGWRTGLVPEVYASGRAMHLVIWSGDAEGGTPCGRAYPISAGINAHMAELARIFAGPASGPPLYVTLFTEFQTYACTDNQWSGAEDYYTALQAKMLAIRDIFRQNAPNARVSIGWGGWQAGWDGPGVGGGRSLFPHFAATMRAMDFQSFQAMERDTNVNDVVAMTRTLGAYGPVMLSHHKPNGFLPTVFAADLTAMMTRSFLTQRVREGLFAWSFMDSAEMDSSPAIFNQVKTAVDRYGVP